MKGKSRSCIVCGAEAPGNRLAELLESPFVCAKCQDEIDSRNEHTLEDLPVESLEDLLRKFKITLSGKSSRDEAVNILLSDVPRMRLYAELKRCAARRK